MGIGACIARSTSLKKPCQLYVPAVCNDIKRSYHSWFDRSGTLPSSWVLALLHFRNYDYPAPELYPHQSAVRMLWNCPLQCPGFLSTVDAAWRQNGVRWYFGAELKRRIAEVENVVAVSILHLRVLCIYACLYALTTCTAIFVFICNNMSR